MFARLSAKVMLIAAGVGLVFFGVGLIGFAISGELTARLGTVGGEALTGALFLFPPLIWALSTHMRRPPPPPQNNAGRDLMRVLFAAVAKQTPWIAVVGAGLAGAADLFLNRNKPKN